MRTIFILVAVIVGCSGDPAGPSVGQPSAGLPPEAPVLPVRLVDSIIMGGPEAIRVSDSVKLTVALLNKFGHSVSNVAVSFASSDIGIATVDNLGLVRGLAEGFVTISASSESHRAEKILRIVGSLRCSARGDECVGKEERYQLVLVNGQPLPAKSPWGAGDWDYDADAGTWKATSAELILSVNGEYTQTVLHRGASGATSTFSFGGFYIHRAGKISFFPDGSIGSSAVLTAGGVVDVWTNGTKLEYVRSESAGSPGSRLQR